MKKLYFAIIALGCSIAANAQWTTICNTGNGFVVDLATYNNVIFSTGFFTRDCGSSTNYINGWDGTTWNPLGPGLDDAGHRICVLGPDDMFVAKYQQTVDSNWVYKWDGSQFAKFGKSLYLTTAVAGFSKTPNLYDIVVYHGDTIVSGEFDLADGKHISGIARWAGTTWDSLGSGLSDYLTLVPSDVMYPHQMLVYQDTLYVVGNFMKAGGITVNGVAKWDGAQWHAMGAGFDRNVYALAVYNGELFAGGGFTQSGATTLGHIAKWNGVAWTDPGFSVRSGLTAFDDAYVHTLRQIGTRLFITGGFTHVLTPADTQACGNIIAWDGTAVNTLSGGTPNYQIEGIVPYGTNSILVAGGYNNDSSYVAKYDLTPLDVAMPQVSTINVYPIPATGMLHVDGVEQGSSTALFDMLGTCVYTAVILSAPHSIDVSTLASGIYVLHIAGAKGVTTRRIVKE